MSYDIKEPIPAVLHDGRIIDANYELGADFYNAAIDPFTISNSLSKIARYNGQSRMFYSVAEHSLKLALYALNATNLTKEYPEIQAEDRENLALALLLHDAAEAFIGDVPSHIKKHLPHFQALDDKLSARIYEIHGLTDTIMKFGHIVQDLDRRICFDEMYQLFGRIDPVFYTERLKPLAINLEYTPADKAVEAFINLFNQLKGN